MIPRISEAQMAFFLDPILLLLIFLIVPTYFLYLRKSGNPTKNPPPGSFGFPLVGETHQFFSKNIEIFLQERKTKYFSDFFKTNILGEPTVIFSGPSGNKFLSVSEPKLVKVWYLKTQRKFFNILSHPAQQQQAAAKSNSTPIKILGFFKPEGLMKYMGKIESVTQQHLRTYWEGKNELDDTYPLLKFFVLTVVYQVYFGLHDPHRVARFVYMFDRLHAGIYSIPMNFPGTRYCRALKAARAIREEVQLIMQEKVDGLSRGLVMDDLLAQVLEAEKGGKYVPKLEVCNIIMGLMNASYTSLASTLTLMIKHIGQRPDIYQKLVSEHAHIAKSRGASRALDWESIQKMKYTWTVAQETMRLHPTAPGGFREAVTDIFYENFTVPKGWKIFWAMTATNKNPKYFPEPENFDPSRFEGNGPAPFTFIPFGAGPRSCIGKDYARILILTFMHHLITKFKWEVINPHHKIISDVILNIPSGLGIRFLQL